MNSGMRSGLAIAIIALGSIFSLARAAEPVPTELTGVSKKQSEATQEEKNPWSGSLTITNNYVYRGLTQTASLPAFEGSLTYTWYESGIYLNLWGSNINQIARNGAHGTVEVDAIAGIGNDINDDWSYNLSLERYNYPKAQDIGYTEGIGVLTYKILSATLGYSSNEFNTHEPGYYLALAVSYDIPKKYLMISDVNLAGTIGYYFLAKESGFNYGNLLIGISKNFGIYNLALQWSDSSRQDKYLGFGGSFIIALLTASF